MEKIDKFSMARTISLIVKIINEQRRVFIMRLLLMIGSLSIISVFFGAFMLKYIYSYSDGNKEVIEQEVRVSYIMFYVLGLVYTSFAFNDAKSKKGRISMLMLPVRAIENYIARFVIYVGAYIAAFVAAMWVADALRVLAVSVFYPSLIDNVHIMTADCIFNEETSIILAVFLLNQSFYWLGAILWPRNSLIKTFAALNVLSIFYVVVAFIVVRTVIGDDNYRVEFLENYQPNMLHWLWGVTAVVCLINYGIAYLRLKETDVIQRLL